MAELTGGFRKRAGRRVAFVVGVALAILVAEFALNFASPYRPKREVEDGVRELQAGDPDILAISSSHGRSFHVLGEEITRRTRGRVSVVAFAVEAGQVRAMEWVLRHRAVPLLDERDAAGNRKRARLRHLIFGVTWWDTCRRGSAPPVDHNVVSRAWTWRDYWEDVAAHGINEINRNFVRHQVQRQLRSHRLGQLQESDLLQQLADRLTEKLAAAKLPAALADVSSTGAVQIPPALVRWRQDIETGQSCLLFPSELEALERMEAFARQRGIEFTVVLFPLMPQTVTPAGERTLERFTELMRKRGVEQGYRVIDMTLPPFLSDADFMRDMDHLSSAGNAKFADWALQHDLAFLLDEPRQASAAAMGSPR
jgi:hypothetical protein